MSHLREAEQELSRLGAVYAEVVDMTQEQSVYAFADHVVEKLGPIDSWVNNVGAQLTKGPDEEEYSDALLEKIYGICFKAAVFGCQAAFRSMKHRGGSIVNISSLGGRCPTTGAATLYGPLKAATNMLSVTMGGEYAAYGVRVNTVMPGYIMTEFNTDHTTDENMKHICAGTLLQRPGQVDEVAMPIVFMCGKLTLDDLEKCGYRDGDMLPLSKERAMELYERDLTVYAVVDGGSAEMLFDREELALLSVDRKRK